MLNIISHNLEIKSNPALKEAYEGFIESNHSFIHVLQNKLLWQITGEYAGFLKKNFDKLVVVGIGGSHLGTESFIKALSFPRKVIFFENPDPVGIQRRWDAIEDLNRTHFMFISKSGGTFETLAIANWVIDNLKSKNLEVAKHCSVLTAKDDSALKVWSDKVGAWCLKFPEDVSGRFSALTPVGMLPLIFGLDKSISEFFSEFFQGADSVLGSHARGIKLLEIYNSLLVNQFQTMNFWVYSDQMLGFGRWLRQLWSESLGQTNLPKDLALPVFVLCKGASDQHSYLQQAIAKSQNHVNFILTLKKINSGFAEQSLEKDHFNSGWGFENRSFLDLFNAESMGLVKTFKELEIPFVHLELEEVNLKALVDFVLLHQVVIASLGQFLKINPFDQPQVEEMKKRISELQKSKIRAQML